MAQNMNWVDYIILAVFLFSTLAGLFRGLVREMIALLTWVAAFIISGLFAKDLAAYFTQTSGQSVPPAVSGNLSALVAHSSGSISLLAVGGSFIFLFVITLFSGSLINYFVSRAVDAGGISIGNRLLGGVFGLIRGFFVNWIMIFLVQLSPLSQQPVWKSSQCVAAFQPIVVWLNHLVYPGIDGLKNTIGDTMKNLNAQSSRFHDIISSASGI